MDNNNLVWNNQTHVSNSTECQNLSVAVCQLGPPRDPLSTVIPMTLVYSVILTTGVTGNICTCIVIYRNRYMHTATNYYLFSLAVSDLLLLVLGEYAFFLSMKITFVLLGYIIYNCFPPENNIYMHASEYLKETMKMALSLFKPRKP